MSGSERTQAAIRVERGEVRAEELAALALALLALRGSAADKGDDGVRSVAGVRWWRGGEGYRAPDSWQ